MIGGQQSQAAIQAHLTASLTALDPQNSPKGVKNEDMEKLRDRFSGWV